MKQFSSILTSPCRGTWVQLHLLRGGTELGKMRHKPRRDIQETFRENQCLACFYCLQNANIGFSEAHKVAKQG